MKLPLFLSVSVTVLASLASSAARANGVVSHVHISNLAVERLPPGEVRDLMTDPELTEAYRAGSVFPDSGYAAGDPYGEMAHWEPFTEAMIQSLREEYGPPYDSLEARRLVAFLMGQASHGMADQWFDSLFMARVRQFDGTADTLDVYAENWLIVEHDPAARVEGWLEAEVIDRVFADHLEYSPTPEVLRDGMEMIVLAIGVLYDFARTLYPSTWMALPWAATHYDLLPEDAPGGLPHIAEVVALYWQVLWERLNDTDDLDDSFLLSWPVDGQENFEVDHGLVETRIAVAFGHGFDRDTLTSENVTLTDAEGAPVPARVHFIYGSPFANVVLVDPEIDLDYDTVYTVSLGAGLTAMDGRSLTTPIAFSFRTRCAPDHLEDCPPLPDPWEPPEAPPELPDLPDAGADADLDGGPDADADGPPDAGGADADLDGGPDADADGPPDAGGADDAAPDGADGVVLYGGGGGGCTGCRVGPGGDTLAAALAAEVLLGAVN